MSKLDKITAIETLLDLGSLVSYGDEDYYQINSEQADKLIEKVKAEAEFKSKLDLTDPTSQAFCCGTLCDKRKAQAHIDHMQRVIDACHQLLNYGDMPEDIVAELKSQLSELASKD